MLKSLQILLHEKNLIFPAFFPEGRKSNTFVFLEFSRTIKALIKSKLCVDSINLSNSSGGLPSSRGEFIAWCGPLANMRLIAHPATLV